MYAAFVIHDKQETLVKYEQFLQSRGVPCEFMFYNEGKCELFIPKAEKDRALALLTSYKKTHSEKGFCMLKAALIPVIWVNMPDAHKKGAVENAKKLFFPQMERLLDELSKIQS